MDVRFDWDEHNAGHIAAHGVSPAEAEQVFHNAPAEKQRHTRNGEERILLIGETDAGRKWASWQHGAVVASESSPPTRSTARERNDHGEKMKIGDDDYPQIPAFKSERAEAQWWDKHPEVLIRIIDAAKRDGTVTYGEVLKKIARRKTMLTTIRLFVDDLKRAKAIAHKKASDTRPT